MKKEKNILKEQETLVYQKIHELKVVLLEKTKKVRKLETK